jgi:L-fucose isomerase-like protein
MHAVIEVPELQKLMRHICKNGHAHHAAMNASHVADIVAEAFEDYLGWDVKGGDAISSKELVNKPLIGLN